MIESGYLEIELADNEIKNRADSDLDLIKFVEQINDFFPAENLWAKKKKEQVSLYLHSLKPEILERFASQHQGGQVLKEKINSIKSYGISQGELIFHDYDRERKVKNRDKKARTRGKYFYAKNNDFNQENNQLNEEYINKIVCADSEEYLKKLPDNCIDIIFTSPPYNFGLDYEATDDAVDWEKYLDKLFSVFSECIRILKYGGRFVVNVQPLFSDYIPLHHMISNFFIRRQLIWKTEILWEKNNYNCKYTAWGSWKSPSSPYFKYTWEFIEVFMKGKLKKEGNKENIDITAEEFKDWVYARWDIAPEKKMEEFDHPAMFPLELAERVLKIFSYQGDIALDPFGGVGTLALAAQKNKRKFLSVDISEEYTQTARKRLKETTLD